ncbi:hypothetical protein DLAC_10655 [Tieghemostelium lacteum]|uniref:F-box domain-containing protein n=1 Tax=Tieghemostelium lacteum TaxID=361077 RepID=A0A151Z4F7_TIELA|nr:hypothetical protein DLAC_10655 [Tieghemostelium lacteum]|eukprot:KYQ88852.1 hypothetical protein DLAC_10655 [Tieghemostelium lacteum]
MMYPLPNIITKKILNYLVNFNRWDGIDSFLQKFTLICKEWNKIIASLEIYNNLYFDYEYLDVLNLLNRYNIKCSLLTHSDPTLIGDKEKYVSIRVTKETYVSDGNKLNEFVKEFVNLKDLYMYCKFLSTTPPIPDESSYLMSIDFESWYKNRNISISVTFDIRSGSLTIPTNEFVHLNKYWSKLNIIHGTFSIDMVSNTLSQPTPLRALVLTNVEISLKSMIFLLQNSPQLAIIKFQNINAKSNDSFHNDILNYLVDTDLPSLVSLSIKSWQREVDFQNMVNFYNRTKIRILNIQFKSFFLKDGLNQNIGEYEISNPHIQSNYFEAIIVTSKGKNQPFNFLSIWKDKSNLKVITVDNIYGKVDDIKSFTNLSKLTYSSDYHDFLEEILGLSLPKFRNLNIENTHYPNLTLNLIEPIHNNKILTTLNVMDISQNDLEKLLAFSKSLVEISVNTVHLNSDSSITLLIQHIKDNRILQKLFIKHSYPISIDNILHYVDIYRNGHQITHLTLPESPSHCSLEELENMITKNPNIFYLGTENKQIQKLLKKYFIQWE